jgi:hypothetical protein
VFWAIISVHWFCFYDKTTLLRVILGFVSRFYFFLPFGIIFDNNQFKSVVFYHEQQAFIVTAVTKIVVYF